MGEVRHVGLRFWRAVLAGRVSAGEDAVLALPWGSVEWIVWGEFVSLMGYLEGREGGREDDNVEGRREGGMDWG